MNETNYKHLVCSKDGGSTDQPALIKKKQKKKTPLVSQEDGPVIYNPPSHQQPHLHAYKQTHQYLTDREVVSSIARRVKEVRSLSCAYQEIKKINCSQMGILMQNNNGFTS